MEKDKFWFKPEGLRHIEKTIDAYDGVPVTNLAAFHFWKTHYSKVHPGVTFEEFCRAEPELAQRRAR